jgi:hypothetical protein
MSDDGSPKTQLLSPHERLFIATFVDPSRRQRWAEFLGNKGRRELFLTRLADSRDLIRSLMRPIEPSAKNAKQIIDQLNRWRIPDHCHIISQCKELDGCEMPVKEAINEVFGIGLGSVVSCLPGKIAYYDGEMPKDKWLLVAHGQQWV